MFNLLYDIKKTLNKKKVSILNFRYVLLHGAECVITPSAFLFRIIFEKMAKNREALIRKQAQRLKETST